jgi:hypothetical protein
MDPGPIPVSPSGEYASTDTAERIRERYRTDLAEVLRELRGPAT